MTRVLSSIFLTTMVFACSGDDKGQSTDSGAAADDSGAAEDGGVEGWPAGQNCPDDVPEEVAGLWDCELNSCETKDDVIVYKLGTGTSTAETISLTEEFWVFNRDREWYVDTFTIEGELPDDGTNVSTFNCDSCEEIWQYQRVLTESQTGYGWTNTLNDKGNESGKFNGYMMFDTHTAFGDRNPDDAALVYAVHFDSDWDDWSKGRSEWGRGTATPTGSEDAPPEEYWYRSPSGSCF